mmetsp:Transcript_105917/g.297817  ORF Transcript_105917/g.297817 Transcript_105917/m.297817 type:complete len:210 (+) Transcript_105917:416-1045(+)
MGGLGDRNGVRSDGGRGKRVWWHRRADPCLPGVALRHPRHRRGHRAQQRHRAHRERKVRHHCLRHGPHGPHLEVAGAPGDFAGGARQAGGLAGQALGLLGGDQGHGGRKWQHARPEGEGGQKAEGLQGADWPRREHDYGQGEDPLRRRVYRGIPVDLRKQTFAQRVGPLPSAGEPRRGESARHGLPRSARTSRVGEARREPRRREEGHA